MLIHEIQPYLTHETKLLAAALNCTIEVYIPNSEEDIDRIDDFFRENIGERPRNETFRCYYNHYKKPQNSNYFGLFEIKCNQQVIARVCCEIVPSHHDGHIIMPAVAKTVREAGVGSLLMFVANDALLAHGAKSLCLQTSFQAVQFYESFGLNINAPLDYIHSTIPLNSTFINRKIDKYIPRPCTHATTGKGFITVLLVEVWSSTDNTTSFKAYDFISQTIVLITDIPNKVIAQYYQHQVLTLPMTGLRCITLATTFESPYGNIHPDQQLYFTSYYIG